MDTEVGNKLKSVASIARGYFRSRDFTRKPIIIGGCERSGTTLLLSVLSAHPNFFAIDRELWSFCYGPKAGFDSANPIKPRRLYKYLGENPIPKEAHRWCEKTPANVFYFDEILDYFDSNVRLIQIVRDGRDVVSSIHPDSKTKPWVPPGRWVEALQAGMKHADHGRVLTIRYEDLIESYLPTVTRILDFVNEDEVSEIEEWHLNSTIRQSRNLVGKKVPKLHASSIRKFEKPDFQFADNVEQLLAIPDAKKLLERYGYL